MFRRENSQAGRNFKRKFQKNVCELLKKILKILKEFLRILEKIIQELSRKRGKNFQDN